MIYEKLRDVKVLYGMVPTVAGYSFFGPVMRDVPSRKNVWTAIYNAEHKKWIVTNDIHQHGLQADAEILKIVGFADDIDAIMFVVWEHQKSLGIEHTILDEIRDIKNEKIGSSDNEWKWGAESESGFTRLFSSTTSTTYWTNGGDGNK